MTFDPKTFSADLRAAQRWLERELGYQPKSQGYPPSISLHTGYGGGKFTITNNWMNDTHKVEGVDLVDAVQELKRRLGYQESQDVKASALLIEAKPNG